MKKIIYILPILIFILPVFLVPVFAQDTATSSDTIRQKVQEKIKEALNNPKAYIGTITDKTDTGLQIKATTGEILQISLNPTTSTFVKVDKSSKTIKFADVGIGDYIIAMGFVTNNDILDAKRIIVTTAEQETTRVVILGTVAKINKNGITLIDKAGDKNTDVTFLKTVFFTKEDTGVYIKARFSEIGVGDTLLIAGVKQENSILARTVHIVNFATLPSPTPKSR